MLRIGATTRPTAAPSLQAIPQTLPHQQTAQFSATASRQKRKKGVKKDPKISTFWPSLTGGDLR